MYRTARNIALNYMNKAESRLVDSLEHSADDEPSYLKDPSVDTLECLCAEEEFSLYYLQEFVPIAILTMPGRVYAFHGFDFYKDQ